MFKIFFSESQNQLADLLLEQLKENAPSDPFVRQIIVTHSFAMNQYLALKMSEGLGITLNCNFYNPSLMVKELLAIWPALEKDSSAAKGVVEQKGVVEHIDNKNNFFDSDRNSFKQEFLRWHIFSILIQKPFSENDFVGDDSQSIFQLANQMALLFASYEMKGEKILEGWESNLENEQTSFSEEQVRKADHYTLQKIIWSTLREKIDDVPHRTEVARLNEKLVKLTEEEKELLREKMPSINIFGITRWFPISIYLDMFKSMSRVIDLNYFALQMGHLDRDKSGQLVLPEEISDLIGKDNQKADEKDDGERYGSHSDGLYHKFTIRYYDLLIYSLIKLADETHFVQESDFHGMRKKAVPFIVGADESILTKLKKCYLMGDIGNSENDFVKNGIANLSKNDFKKGPLFDGSIIVRYASSKIREVEAMSDYLTHLLLKKNGPRVEASDVLVLAYDINDYTAHIKTLMKDLPFSIADEKRSHFSPMGEAFIELFLLLIDEDFPTLLDLQKVLEMEFIHRAWGMVGYEHDLLKLVEIAGFRYGFGKKSYPPNQFGDGQKREQYRKKPSSEDDWKYSWEHAKKNIIDTFILRGGGRSISEEEKEIDFSKDMMRAFGEISSLMSMLQFFASEIRKQKKMEDWGDWIKRVILKLSAKEETVRLGNWDNLEENRIDFAGHDNAEKETVGEGTDNFFIQETIEMLDEDIRDLFDSIDSFLLQVEKVELGEVDFSIFFNAWEEGISATALERGYMTGGITFSSLRPMRAIPFKVVYILGMSGRDFPPKSFYSSFDLTVTSSKVNDLFSTPNSSSFENRQLVFEAFWSAKERLVVSFFEKGFEGGAVDKSGLSDKITPVFEDLVGPFLDIREEDYSHFLEECTEIIPTSAHHPDNYLEVEKDERKEGTVSVNSSQSLKQTGLDKQRKERVDQSKQKTGLIAGVGVRDYEVASRRGQQKREELLKALSQSFESLSLKRIFDISDTSWQNRVEARLKNERQFDEKIILQDMIDFYIDPTKALMKKKAIPFDGSMSMGRTLPNREPLLHYKSNFMNVDEMDKEDYSLFSIFQQAIEQDFFPVGYPQNIEEYFDILKEKGVFPPKALGENEIKKAISEFQMMHGQMMRVFSDIGFHVDLPSQPNTSSSKWEEQKTLQKKRLSYQAYISDEGISAKHEGGVDSNQLDKDNGKMDQKKSFSIVISDVIDMYHFHEKVSEKAFTKKHEREKGVSISFGILLKDKENDEIKGKIEEVRWRDWAKFIIRGLSFASTNTQSKIVNESYFVTKYFSLKFRSPADRQEQKEMRDILAKLLHVYYYCILGSNENSEEKVWLPIWPSVWQKMVSDSFVRNMHNQKDNDWEKQNDLVMKTLANKAGLNNAAYIFQKYLQLFTDSEDLKTQYIEKMLNFYREVFEPIFSHGWIQLVGTDAQQTKT